MVSVGVLRGFYMFGGFNADDNNKGGSGEEGLCDDAQRLSACQIERLGDVPRAAALLVATSCARAGCHAIPPRVW